MGQTVEPMTFKFWHLVKGYLSYLKVVEQFCSLSNERSSGGGKLNFFFSFWFSSDRITSDVLSKIVQPVWDSLLSHVHKHT